MQRRRGVIAARGGTAEQLARVLVSELEAIPAFDQNPERSSYRYHHIYRTGAALGLLLDRMGIEWRPRMQQGETFPDLVRIAAE